MFLTRLPEGVNSTTPRNALRKNASGVAMRMKIRQSKTPQLLSSVVLSKQHSNTNCSKLVHNDVWTSILTNLRVLGKGYNQQLRQSRQSTLAFLLTEIQSTCTRLLEYMFDNFFLFGLNAKSKQLLESLQ